MQDRKMTDQIERKKQHLKNDGPIRTIIRGLETDRLN